MHMSHRFATALLPTIAHHLIVRSMQTRSRRCLFNSARDERYATPSFRARPSAFALASLASEFLTATLTETPAHGVGLLYRCFDENPTLQQCTFGARLATATASDWMARHPLDDAFAAQSR